MSCKTILGIIIAAIFVFSLAGCSNITPASGPKSEYASPKADYNAESEQSYLPLNVGNKWDFDYSLGSKKDYIDSTEIVNGETAYVLKHEFRGNVNQIDYYVQRADGIYSVKKDIALKNLPKQSRVFDTPILVLKNELIVGDTWEDEFLEGGVTIKAITEVLGAEEVEVPAGRFDAVKVKIEVYADSDLAAETYKWFAKGVGNVKEEAHTDMPVPTDMVKELRYYELAVKEGESSKPAASASAEPEIKAGAGVLWPLEEGAEWLFESKLAGNLLYKVIGTADDGTATVDISHTGESVSKMYIKKEGNSYYLLQQDVMDILELEFEEPLLYLKDSMKPGDSWTSESNTDFGYVEMKVKVNGVKEIAGRDCIEVEYSMYFDGEIDKITKMYHAPGFGICEIYSKAVSLGGIEDVSKLKSSNVG